MSQVIALFVGSCKKSNFYMMNLFLRFMFLLLFTSRDEHGEEHSSTPLYNVSHNRKLRSNYSTQSRAQYVSV